MSSAPLIRPLKWSPIREVLAHEAHDFTPWLASNLDVLADAVGLDDLALVETESFVADYRLDILARGTDGSGEDIAVVIENQYGRSDHDHLGKLVTYAAKAEAEAERVLAVWVVEEATPAHLAAVEFLNRTSADFIGWVLASVRFAPAPDNSYYVHFDKHAEPNAFLRDARRSARTVTPERVSFMQAVFEQVDKPLRQAGFRRVWCHPDGTMIRAYLPSHLPAADWLEIRVLAAKQRFRVALFVRGGQVPAEHNTRVLRGVRERHGRDIAAAAIEGPEAIEWHASHDSERSDYARYTWEGRGYENPDVEGAAARVTSFATACLAAVNDEGREEFPELEDLTVGSLTS